MNWVLIVLFMQGRPTPAQIITDFQSQSACVEAGENIKRDMTFSKWGTIDIRYSCIEQK